MAWKLTINGVDRTTDVHLPNRVRMTLQANERSTARFTLLDLIPTRFHEVVIYHTDGTTPIFGGLIQVRGLNGLEDESASVLVGIVCADFGMYGDWCYTTHDYSAASVYLKVVLQNLISENLGVYGITLASMGNGPLLDPFKWKNYRVSDALRELTKRTGYVFAFSPTKVLSMVAPGTEAAPYTVTDGAGNANVKSFGWDDPSEIPPTKVRLQCGPSSGFYWHEETVVANGTDTHWHFSVPGGNPGVATLNGTEYCTIGYPGAMFTWNPDTAVLTLDNHSVPTNGTTIKVEYWVPFPFELVVPANPATPIVEMLASAEGALTYAQGVNIATGILNQNHTGRQVKLLSRKFGWRPSQKITIARTDRNMNAFALITVVDVTLTTDSYWEFNITGLEGTTFSDTYLDQWRNLTGGTSSSSGGTAVGGGGGTSTAYFHAHIGGSSSRTMNGVSWIEIAECKTCTVPASGTYTFRFEACTENAGTSIQVRLHDETAGAEVSGSTSAPITATTFAGGRTAVSVALIVGHVYYAQYQNSNSTYGTLVRQASLEA